MLVFLLIASPVVLSLLSCFGIYFARRWQSLFAWSSLAAVVYLYGAWVYLSVYVKFVHGGLALLLLCYALMQWPKRQHKRIKGLGLGLIAIGLLLTTLVVLYFTGTTGVPKTVALDFPLRQGRYFVLQGGKGLPANFFHYSYRGAVYAMDICRLDDYGRRAKAIFSKHLDDYYIFADTIYSPCNGRVLKATNENRDNTPPLRKRGPTNNNAVLIETDTMYVYLAHLKYQNVFVREGDSVKLGQPIGLVGNSGFTLEPHLHIQVHRKTGLDQWYREEQLYIQFNGRSYLLFEIIPRKRTAQNASTDRR